MNRALILSRLRIEVRRKGSGYPTERTMIRNVKKFMDRMSLTHTSQIREWHKDLFLSQLKNNQTVSEEEFLQSKSSLLFLFERVLKPSNSFVQADHEYQKDPEIFRITG